MYRYKYNVLRQNQIVCRYRHETFITEYTVKIIRNLNSNLITIMKKRVGTSTGKRIYIYVCIYTYIYYFSVFSFRQTIMYKINI